MDDHMHVFRHEHVGPEVKVERFSCIVNRLYQPEARSFGFQELISPVATERQFVGMALLVIIPPFTSDRHEQAAWKCSGASPRLCTQAPHVTRSHQNQSKRTSMITVWAANSTSAAHARGLSSRVSDWAEDSRVRFAAAPMAKNGTMKSQIRSVSKV